MCCNEVLETEEVLPVLWLGFLFPESVKFQRAVRPSDHRKCLFGSSARLSTDFRIAAPERKTVSPSRVTMPSSRDFQVSRLPPASPEGSRRPGGTTVPDI
ncbi:hypothetical protein Zmor_003535 [Zophobas morio]|uniref:Uncharacterized protein n=1 Tax=Zophobas morio TaxID=2755281 RepID=A0AA38M2S5_9CUCU|nr:hypothetical protein Zmor_003535 [Zophobas morio]